MTKAMMNKQKRQVGISSRSRSSSTFVTKSAVKQMLQAQLEPKRLVGVTSASVVTAGALIFKSSIAQGDTYDARNGDKIIPKFIDYNLRANDPTNSATFRFLIFQDTSNTGAAPAVTDVLSSATVEAHMNPVYELAHRFRVLVDRTIDLNIAGNNMITVHGKIRFTMPIYFNGTGGTVTDGGKNSLYALVIGTNTSTAYILNTMFEYTDG